MKVRSLENESELLAALAGGSERAFEKIYWHYVGRIHPYVLKMVKDELVAEEIVQEIFVQLWEKRALLSSVQHPTSYIFHMASSRTLNYLKKQSNHSRILMNYARLGSELVNATADDFDLKESAAIIEEAVAQLPEQRRLIFEMSRKQGMSNEQIADELSLSRQTVKNQLVHALKFIRSFMEKRQKLFSFAIYFLLTGK
ncbi:RNA polymerase sigma-70 factor [Pedobacter sp. KBW01]|uniref:RNA polymerase sigma-70 factor n=1 Tax=Pedobacter sp. KBW01 TaxID=2153364 RepID=UPI000F5B2B6E|nr:RNA polymerase sigma-70 factor [Pedobacter sp. KBW01]RQO78145.1 RNA polymerase sigma-70 factor [Pedobacter sp. KBW01]